MSKAIFVLICRHTTTLYDYLTSNNTNKDRARDLLTQLTQQANAFKQELLRNPVFDKNAFIDENIGELFKIHNTLVGPVKMLFLSSDLHALARGVHDILFNTLALKQPKRRFASLPTQLCQDFCKGITYFSHDEPFKERPFYHRPESCGTSAKTSEEKFGSNTHLIKEYVKKCYIERLIYDAIYTNTFHQQDLGHMFELRKMKQLYQKYFDGSTIAVSITYSGIIYPCQLTIIYMNNAQGLIYETYTKNTCERKDGDKVFEKVQSFDQESAWTV